MKIKLTENTQKSNKKIESYRNLLTDNSLAISAVEETDEQLTGRGGVAAFSRYTRQIGLPGLLAESFSEIRKNSGGYNLRDIFHQTLCFMADGTLFSLSHFNRLKNSSDWMMLLETTYGRLCSTDQVKRFFKAFKSGYGSKFRNILRLLFLQNLKSRNEKPDVIEIMIDTTVLNNNDAATREGVKPTYKKVKGFQPLHFIWNGQIIDAVFRNGSKTGNYGNVVINSINRLVKLIRQEYCPDTPIVFLMDSGFFDQKIFDAIEQAGAFFIASGKQYCWVKEALFEAEVILNDHKNDLKWICHEFDYCCQNWDKSRRGIYLFPYCCRETGQLLFKFERPESIIVTNIDSDSWKYLKIPEYIQLENIINRHHSRGLEELTHRNLKEFGTEKLPFKSFNANTAFYYLMVIAHSAFRNFTEQVIIPAVSDINSRTYPTTIRRRIFDIAARFVTHSRRLIMKLTADVYESLKFQLIWKLSNSPAYVFR